MRLWPGVVLMVSLSAHAEWGTLFLTPEQRATLNETARSASASAPRAHRFDGELRSSSGHAVRWINGSMQTGLPPPKGIRPGEQWTSQPTRNP